MSCPLNFFTKTKSMIMMMPLLRVSIHFSRTLVIQQKKKFLLLRLILVNFYITGRLIQFFLQPVTEAEVADMIKDLSISKACGPYSIPNNLLKHFCSFFTKPLEILINKSLSEGNFTNILKLADVCPIFKKSDKNKCENYRLISLLSNLSKLFERAMHTRVYKYL